MSALPLYAERGNLVVQDCRQHVNTVKELLDSVPHVDVLPAGLQAIWTLTKGALHAQGLLCAPGDSISLWLPAPGSRVSEAEEFNSTSVTLHSPEPVKARIGEATVTLTLR